MRILRWNGVLLFDFTLHNVWANKSKLSLNPDPSNQSQEVFFSRKINKVYHPPLLFNNSTVQQISSQKYLGIHLDEELTFKHHINEKINQANKYTEIIRKLNDILPRFALLTIYRYFIRRHSTMVMWFMICLKMNCLVVRLNQFNTMRLLP